MANQLAALSNEIAAVVALAARNVVAVHARPRFSSSGVFWRPGVIVTADYRALIEFRTAAGQTVQFPAKRSWYHRLKGLHLYIDFPKWRRIFRDFRPDVTHVHYPDGGGATGFTSITSSGSLLRPGAAR